MVDDVAEDQGPDRGTARHREQFQTSSPKRPHRVQLGVAAVERLPGAGRLLVELLQDLAARRWLGAPGRREVEVEGSRVQYVQRPAGDLDQVRRERADRPRQEVRFPGEPIVRHALQQTPGRCDLVVVFGEQRLASGHGRSVMLACLAAVLMAGAVACRRTPVPPPPPRPPQTSGTIAVAGLRAPVTVVRDRTGIPHITASNTDDLFFSQGFVQAQDRLFQMDLWRRAAQGRLSETLGANFIERDAMTRRMQFRGDIGQEWASYGPETRAIAGAFTRGINAWVAMARADLPEEFAAAGWLPDYWKAEDLLNRTDAFVASGDAQGDLLRARLAAEIGIDAVRRLLPAPEGQPLNVSPGVDLSAITYVVPETVRRAGTPAFFSALAGPVTNAPRPNEAALQSPSSAAAETVDGGAVIRRTTVPSGSAWVVGPSRSATGGSLLAVSGVLPWNAPAGRYIVHLTAPGWNVAGATAPWMPGVAVGHNDRIAWGVTATRSDTQDIFVERINPDDPHQVERDGRWVDMSVDRERIDVKGRTTPFEYERLYTPHGVVIALDRERHLAYVLRWIGAEPGGAGELAAPALNRASTWTEFRSAVARWKMPVSEFVYADADGHIARVATGAVPVRSRGSSGAMPEAAWTGEAWKGGQRDALAMDPANGMLISTVNGAQRSRLSDALAEVSGHTLDSMQRLQHDTMAWNASRLLPLVERAAGLQEPASSVRGRLLAWDRRVNADSDAALLYVAFEEALVRLLAERRVPREFVADVAARVDVVAVVTSPTGAWFDGDPARARDRLIADALNAAAAEGRSAPPALVFTHPLAVFAEGRRRFDVGPVPRAGYASTVFATTQRAGPAFRAVFDVSNWDRSLVLVAPGQAGSPASVHYDDMAPLWVSGRSVELAFTPDAVAAGAAETLILTPR